MLRVALIVGAIVALVGGTVLLGHPGVVPFLPSALARMSLVGTVRAGAQPHGRCVQWAWM
jgi:hypothetical protein